MSLHRAEETCELRVADEGPGLTPAEATRVTDRFYRGSETIESGAGLGLSIAERIADLHGAELAFGEAPGGRGLEACVRFAAVAVRA